MDEKENLRSIFELRSNMQHVFFREFERSLDLPMKLNHTHFKTMMILHFEGIKSMSFISDRVNLEKGSFTTVANTLIELGFVQKIRDDEDRRIFSLKLTNKGQEFAVVFSKNHFNYLNRKLQCLTQEERNSYFSSIQIINALTKKMK